MQRRFYNIIFFPQKEILQLPEPANSSTVTDSPVSHADTVETLSGAEIKQEIMDELPVDAPSDDFLSLSPTVGAISFLNRFSRIVWHS